jgi:hypothetical protein
MFCPKCRAEFRTGFVRCNDCDVDLVEHLTEQGDLHQDTRLVPVFLTRDRIEAAIVRSFLEASGVEVFNVNGGFAVVADQEELARQVLLEYRGKAGEDPSIGRAPVFDLFATEEPESQSIDDAPESLRCPRCRTPLEPESPVCSECGHEL